jgi:uncharacterized membrane protein
MGTLYVAAGINHFVHPATYFKIMPPWLPAHNALVIASGVAEILLGLLLMPPLTRRLAAAGIIILLIAVFPANVQIMLNYRNEDHPLLWLAVLRLPLQCLLIWWAYQYTKPLKRRDAGSSEH